MPIEQEISMPAVTTWEGAGLIALILLLTELNLKLGLDEDGSATLDRVLGILGEFRQLGPLALPIAPAALEEARRRVELGEPLLARIARPFPAPITLRS
jgi:hypothetical protein